MSHRLRPPSPSLAHLLVLGLPLLGCDAEPPLSDNELRAGAKGFAEAEAESLPNKPLPNKPLPQPEEELPPAPEPVEPTCSEGEALPPPKTTHPVTRFAGIADTPYGADVLSMMPAGADQMQWLGVDFLVHVGDIGWGGAYCDASDYATWASNFNAWYDPMPFLYAPGDNEWVDCPDEDASFADLSAHLLTNSVQASSVQGTPVSRQGARWENFAFARNHVQFIGLHLPGGGAAAYASNPTKAQLQADANAWLTTQFPSSTSDAGALVIFTHSEPIVHHGPVWSTITSLATSYAGPVLIVHGDDHDTRLQPYAVANATIWELDLLWEDPGNHGPIHDWSEIEIDPNSGAATPFLVRNHIEGELRLDRHRVGESPTPGDALGHAAAVGDFNCDGFSEYALGLPGANADAGAVLISSNATDNSNGVENWGPTSGTLISQSSLPGVHGVSEAGDRFGDALAVGDFDGDGCDDLAIGAPGESPHSDPAGGAVNVLYGSPGGLGGGQLYYQSMAGFEGVTELGDRWGASLAAGDILPDAGGSRDELVVGVPGEAPHSFSQGGAIQVLRHDASAFVAGDLHYQSQDNLYGYPEAGDLFGHAIAVGDFNGQGWDDIAIGVPGEAPGPEPRGGALQFLFADQPGEPLGVLRGTGTLYYQGAGLGGVIEDGDSLGWAMAAGDFNADGNADLAVGAPYEDPADLGAGGAFHVMMGDPFGFWDGAVRYQSQGGLAGWPEAGDQLGAAFATGDLDADGFEDLVVGVPGEAPDVDPDGGALHILRGYACGLAGAGPLYYPHGTTNADHLIPGDIESGDRFGAAMAIGDMTMDANAELIVGAPGEDQAMGSAVVVHGHDLP